MFTGIVEEMGQVVSLTTPPDGGQDARLVVSAKNVADSEVGASVAVNGVCLTVLEPEVVSTLREAQDGPPLNHPEDEASATVGADETKATNINIAFDIMPQTLKLTGLGDLQPGNSVNLERAMLATSRFDGHVVQGHVDGRATLLQREPGPRWDSLRFQLDPALLAYVAPQGSITVDGVSLTVTEVHDDGFSVALIPTTLAVTTLGELTVGQKVNIEVDALAKYAAHRTKFAENHGLLVTQIAEANLPTAYGTFRIHAFRDSTGIGHVALVNQPKTDDAISSIVPTPLVRVHSECLTGDAFGSLRCDCGPQLQAALTLVAENGGAVLYLRGQEGRGIGLAAKIAAYALQDQGLDTVEANQQLGLPVDARDYTSAAQILKSLGLTRVRLLTNNPTKVDALTENGIEVLERVPIEVGESPINEFYLQTKRDLMGHFLHLAESNR